MFRLSKTALLLGAWALCLSPALAAEGAKVAGKPAAGPVTAAPATPQTAAPATPVTMETMMVQNMKKLHDSLSLTATQEPLWTQFAAAIQNSNKSMDASMKVLHTLDPKARSLSLPEMLSRRDEMMRARLESSQNVRAALDPLYKSLSPQQKEIMDKQAMMSLSMFL